MQVLLNILLTVLVLGVIILIHEIGHYGAAKLFKMNAYQFNMGMGPILWKKQRKETQFALRLFPIGGSVLLGEDGLPDNALEDENEDGENNADKVKIRTPVYSDDPNDFTNRPVYQRIIVIGAGVFLNFVLGLILCMIINIMLVTDPDPQVGVATMTVSAFHPDATSNIGASGLQVGDRIVEVNGTAIFSNTEIAYKMMNSPPKAGIPDYAVFEFVVKRDGKRVKLPNVTFAVVRGENGEILTNELGGMRFVRDFYVLPVENKPLPILEYSARTAIGYGRIIWLTLTDMLRGNIGFNNVGGPVQIVSTVGEITEQSVDFKEQLFGILSLSALITMNLGIVNLLPIPALDGARIIFLAIEGIRRKPLNREVEGTIHFIGFALLMVLIVAVMFNDIARLFGG